MTQAYRALHHNGGMVVKYQVVSWISLGSTTPKPTISFNSSSEMPVCRQNSVIVKVTVTLAIMLSPIFTWIKRRLGVCQLLPQRGSVFIRFRRHHDFQYRIQIAGLFFAHQTLPLTRNRCPAWLPGGIVSKMLSFSVGTVTLVPSAASHGLTGTTISRSWPTISNSGCGAM